jgi:hypothetical protein
VISGFRREVYENCALLGYYAASSGNSLPTFRNNPLVPSSRVIGFLTLDDWIDRLSRNYGRNYHYSLRNSPEELRFHTDLICKFMWVINVPVTTVGLRKIFKLEWSKFTFFFYNDPSSENFCS